MDTGIAITIDLYIAPYIETVHVASLTGSYSKNSKTLTYTAIIENDLGQTVNRVQATASYTYPNGNSGKSKTTTVTMYDFWGGQATYYDFNPSKGTHTLTITDISSIQYNGGGRWRRQPSLIVIYDSSANFKNPPTATVTV